jgi:hypothetical protein
VISPPYEQAGQIQTVVGMQVRQQNVHRVRVRVSLQSP